MFEGNTERPTVEERYSTAVSSSNLAVNPRTAMSDTDVLGAMGIADRELTEGKTRKRDRATGEVHDEPIRPAPLAVALERLLRGGDTRAVHRVVRGMADIVWKEARAQQVKLTHAEATEMAKIVLAWFQHGSCKPCGGHGFLLIPGTKTRGDAACTHCRSERRPGKRPLLKEFPVARRDLADWLRNEVEREAGRAGPRAMAHLAASMDL